MKIEFKEHFRDIDRVVNAPELPVKGSGQGDFSSLLSSISPDKTELAKEVMLGEQAHADRVPLTHDDRGPMARFNFSEPSFEPPPPKPIVEPAPNHVMNQPGHSVKTPTLLGLRRYPVELSHEQQRALPAIKELVSDAGRRHGVDPSLSLAVIARESSFNPQAVSSDGHESKGLFQLLDTTGRDLLKRSGREDNYNPYDPALNTELGVSYLRYLHNIFNESTDLPRGLKTHAAANSSSLEKLAVAAFNAGEGRVASAQARALAQGSNPSVYDNVAPYLPESTKKYVDDVVVLKSAFGVGLESAQA